MKYVNQYIITVKYVVLSTLISKNKLNLTLDNLVEKTILPNMKQGLIFNNNYLAAGVK
jgi:hypothetical protein